MSEGASELTIHINGEVRKIDPGQSLKDLIDSLGLPPQAALVEHNGRALLRSEWPGIHLAGGDRLEILRVVAGG
jgi:thiamine biosynthesis protein ThiS